MSGRLKDVDWQEIIADGKPWSDKWFRHGPYCLFIDHQKPAKENKQSKQKWIDNIHWKRASEFFGPKNFDIFHGVDPSDIIMGNCNNCYALAALSGIAEAHYDEVQEYEKGQRIMDNFLTQEPNEAGCYAIQFIIDGQPRTIAIDDYLPFTMNKNKKEMFAFCKGKVGQNEIWVQLIEKAWAKLCGSYESSEMGRCSEFFENFDGTPTEIHWTDDFDKSYEGESRMQRILTVADKNSWIITASILKRMKK